MLLRNFLISKYLYAFAQFINSEINISLKFPRFDLMVFSLIIIKVYKQIMDQKVKLSALPI